MHRKKISYPCYSSSKRTNSDEYPVLAGYESYLDQHRGVLYPRNLVYVATCFLDYVSAKDKTIKEIGQSETDDFITEQGAFYERATVAGITSSLRSFFKYLFFIGAIEKNYSVHVRRPCVFQGERDPRYLRPWQVSEILAATKRKSVVGKRNYAILLLLAVYGLRGGEIARLTLDDLQWRAGKIVIHNRKCADAIELPMIVDIRRALVEYLHTRPDIGMREVFLTVRKPFRPITQAAVTSMAWRAIARCGFNVAHPGSHTFRYSSAQALFQAERPMDEIAGILGHRKFRTTLGYLSFVAHPLREVAINDGEALA